MAVLSGVPNLIRGDAPAVGQRGKLGSESAVPRATRRKYHCIYIYYKHLLSLGLASNIFLDKIIYEDRSQLKV
jgi:hypothetical protein